MILSLTGFMGAGKTTLGQQLSQQMRARFIDTDAYIEEKEGRTVREIFAEKGEAGFRELEEKYLEDILEEHIAETPETLDDKQHCTLVISLGGGMVTNRVCTDLIRKFTFCIYLKANLETLFARLERTGNERPLLEGREGEDLKNTIRKLYSEREPLYEALAQKVIVI